MPQPTFKEKKCSKCGEPFAPTGSRQTMCKSCGKKSGGKSTKKKPPKTKPPTKQKKAKKKCGCKTERKVRPSTSITITPEQIEIGSPRETITITGTNLKVSIT